MRRGGHCDQRLPVVGAAGGHGGPAAAAAADVDALEAQPCPPRYLPGGLDTDLRAGRRRAGPRAVAVPRSPSSTTSWCRRSTGASRDRQPDLPLRAVGAELDPDPLRGIPGRRRRSPRTGARHPPRLRLQPARRGAGPRPGRGGRSGPGTAPRCSPTWRAPGPARGSSTRPSSGCYCASVAGTARFLLRNPAPDQPRPLRRLRARRDRRAAAVHGGARRGGAREAKSASSGSSEPGGDRRGLLARELDPLPHRRHERARALPQPPPSTIRPGSRPRSSR